MGPKPVNQLLPASPQELLISTTEAGLEQYSERTIGLVNMLFAKMQARYGAKFNSVFKTEEALTYAKREWSEEVEKLSDQDVAQGVKGMVATFTSWPPNLQEFVQLCKPKQEHGQAYKPFEPMLCNSTQAERDAWANIHLTALKKMLGGTDEKSKGAKPATEKAAESGAGPGILQDDPEPAAAESEN